MYNHLLYKGYDIKVGYYGDKEIDFIGEKNGEKLYIQVALKIDSEKTAEREFGNLLKIQDNYPAVCHKLPQVPMYIVPLALILLLIPAYSNE